MERKPFTVATPAKSPESPPPPPDRVPLEFSSSEEIWYRLTRPRRLPRIPRIPRPPVRKIAAFAVGLIPKRVKTSRAAQLARLHPGFAAWLLIFAGVGGVVANEWIGPPNRFDNPARFERWIQKKGTAAVQAALAEIGSGMVAPEVKAQPLPTSVAGTYNRQSHTITFSTSSFFPEFDLMDTAAHECVHAIFTKEKLIPPYSETHGDFFALVNETTAYVLGAYISGDAWSKQGADGRLWSAYMIQFYRNACDPDLPDNWYNKFLAPGRPNSGDFDREEWRSVLIHFPPLQLVDAVDLICCQNPDPTDAAKAIAKRFMRTDLDPRDRPIFEEFERRRQRWGDGR